MNKENIILIGMPGSGKSTCGVLAAKALLKNFFDTDLLFQGLEEKRLQDIIDDDGISDTRIITCYVDQTAPDAPAKLCASDDNGIINLTNLDLPRKVKYKKRNKKEERKQ